MGATTSGLEKAPNPKPGSRQAFSDSEHVAISREKKKKLSKLATLKRKFIRPKRHNRSYDYAKAVRELTSNWAIRELNGLVDEYEALATLKQLKLQTDLARPTVHTFRKDLSDLYDYKYCTDVDLIYQGVCFPVHRVILSVRCPFFRDLLVKYPEFGAQVPVKIQIPRVDVSLFSSLLRYLYCEEFNHDDSSTGSSLEILIKLEKEFGTVNSLEHDMQFLLETGKYSDALLVFTSDLEMQDYLHPDSASESHATKTELRCHKAILAARSPFFRNLLLRRARSGEEATDRALQTASRILLDETVISKQYARVLLHAIYSDVVDTSCIVRNSSSTCSLSEVQAMVAGQTHITYTEQAMEIYQVGQFLDFPILSQGCEDVIVDSINMENIVSVLSWGAEPHGSEFVHRQAMHYLEEEFLPITHSAILYDLNKDCLIRLFKSDFLQAGELDILKAALRWGEYHLIKRMEEREPNLITNTAHSVKKGIKKRDLNDIELRDILSEILPHIRIDHVIPPSNDVLSNAIKRGLVSTPPSHMIVDENGRNRASAWVRGKNNSMFVRPRLFQPYFDEAKSLLDDQITQASEHDLVRLRTFHMSSVPDTLYMLGEQRTRLQPEAASSSVDIIAGTIPVPNEQTVTLMCQREGDVKQCKLVQRACSLRCADRAAIFHQIQLQVVREFGLPDSSVEILQTALTYPEPDPLEYYHFHIRSPSAPGPMVSSCFKSPEKEPSICSDSILSEIMPDIAMATSSFKQINLQDMGNRTELTSTPQCSHISPDIGLDTATYNSLESRRRTKYSSTEGSPDVARETGYHDNRSHHTSGDSPDVTLDSLERNRPRINRSVFDSYSRQSSRSGNSYSQQSSPDISSCCGSLDRHGVHEQGRSESFSPDIAMTAMQSAQHSLHSPNNVQENDIKRLKRPKPDVTGEEGLNFQSCESRREYVGRQPKTTTNIRNNQSLLLQKSASNQLEHKGARRRTSPDVAMGASVLALRDFSASNQSQATVSNTSTVCPDLTLSDSHCANNETINRHTSSRVHSHDNAFISPDVASSHRKDATESKKSQDCATRLPSSGQQEKLSCTAPAAEEEDCDSLNGTLYL